MGGYIIGAGVNEEHTNDRKGVESRKAIDSRRGIDRDHRIREYHSKANDMEDGNFDNTPDNAGKNKKYKRSR